MWCLWFRERSTLFYIWSNAPGSWCPRTNPLRIIALAGVWAAAGCADGLPPPGPITSKPHFQPGILDARLLIPEEMVGVFTDHRTIPCLVDFGWIPWWIVATMPGGPRVGPDRLPSEALNQIVLVFPV